MKKRPESDWAPTFAFTKKFWVGCVCSLLAVALFVSSGIGLLQARSLASEGTLQPATVLAVGETGTQNTPHPKSLITFETIINAVPTTETRMVPPSFAHAHPVGTTWDIRIHPDNTDLIDLYPNQSRNTALSRAALSVLVAIFGTALMLSGDNRAAFQAWRTS